MLFDVKKYKAPAPADPSDLVTSNAEQLVATGGLDQVVGMMDHGKTIHWFTRGEWSMHQLLQKVLEKTGPANVLISSYAFSETPARIIAELRRKGIIRTLSCIIDSRVDVRSASALAILKNTCDILKTCNTHAKITVIQNNNWFLVIAGSANYTANKRIESGYISTDAVIAVSYQKMIVDELTRQ